MWCGVVVEEGGGHKQDTMVAVWKWSCDSWRHRAFFVSSVISLDLGLQYGFCSHTAVKDLRLFDPA